MKIISYFLGVLNISFVKYYLISVYFPLKKRKGNKKESLSIFLFAFLWKKIIFDNMGNIKGFSGIFWFFTIILIPIKMKKYGILAILLLVLLCLLNFLSDIYEYRKEFIREKKCDLILDYIASCIYFSLLIELTFYKWKCLRILLWRKAAYNLCKTLSQC